MTRHEAVFSRSPLPVNLKTRRVAVREDEKRNAADGREEVSEDYEGRFAHTTDKITLVIR